MPVTVLKKRNSKYFLTTRLEFYPIVVTTVTAKKND